MCSGICLTSFFYATKTPNFSGMNPSLLTLLSRVLLLTCGVTSMTAAGDVMAVPVAAVAHLAHASNSNSCLVSLYACTCKEYLFNVTANFNCHANNFRRQRSKNFLLRKQFALPSLNSSQTFGSSLCQILRPSLKTPASFIHSCPGIPAKLCVGDDIGVFAVLVSIDAQNVEFFPRS